MGYSFGEEIFRLEADDFGDWVGQLLWKGADGRKRWDPNSICGYVHTPGCQHGHGQLLQEDAQDQMSRPVDCTLHFPILDELNGTE